MSALIYSIVPNTGVGLTLDERSLLSRPKLALSALQKVTEPEREKRFSTITIGCHSTLGFRPLYPISELGVKEGQPAKNPTWMRLQAASGTAKINEADFRNELDIRKYYPSGLQLDINVSNTTRDRNSKTGWQKMGHLNLTESITSYVCDRQLDFAHPTIQKTTVRPRPENR